MCTFLFWEVHCGIWNRCNVGFVRLVYSTNICLKSDFYKDRSSMTSIAPDFFHTSRREWQWVVIFCTKFQSDHAPETCYNWQKKFLDIHTRVDLGFCQLYCCYFHHKVRIFHSSSATLKRYDMETLSVLLALCEGNPLVTNAFSLQRASHAGFNVFVDASLNMLNEQSTCRPFWTLWHKFRHFTIMAECSSMLIVNKKTQGH